MTAAGIAFVVVALSSGSAADVAAVLFVPAIAALAFIGGVVLVWRVDPAYTFSAAIFLTPFAGHWPRLGVPGPLSPDRLFLAGAIVAVLLRSPPVADRPRFRVSAAHCLLALAVVDALISAAAAGTLLQRDPFLRIVDAFGIMPFLAFLTAPMAFREAAQRRVLLATFVVLGAYLGFTALFEIAKVNALVFPRYILDPSYGIHFGRARGPFVDAVANGLALFTCAVACGVAAMSWRSPRTRAVAVGVGLLCLVGAFLTLERSVWIGAVLGGTAAMLGTHGVRRYFVPLVVGVAVSLAVALAVIPGLQGLVATRASDQQTIWDRKNLDRTAVNMIRAKPLTGFGWNRFESYSEDYFQQARDYPLTATGFSTRNRRFEVHNTPLTYAVELGLLGVSCWLLGLLLGVGGALATRGPPDLRPWRVGLLAIAVALLVVANAVPPIAWPTRSLWLWAGVVYSGRYLARSRGRRDEESWAPA